MVSGEKFIDYGLGSTLSHPLTVELVDHGPGIWGNVATGLVTGLLTGVIALAGIWLTHRLTQEREKRALKEKLARERYFIATDLVFMLERYAEGCARIVTDYGKDNDDRQPEREAMPDYPDLNLTNVSGDWRTLDQHVLYRIRELPVLQNEARGAIAHAAQIPAPPSHEEYFRERQYQFARLGIRAVTIAVRLRREAGLPETRLKGHEWSAVSKFLEVLRRERPLRAAEAVRNKEWNQPVTLSQYHSESTL